MKGRRLARITAFLLAATLPIVLFASSADAKKFVIHRGGDLPSEQPAHDL